jgi:hypothetical protein
VQLFVGRNPNIWKDPELVFDPERFSDAENMTNFSMTHFPFSFGPRIIASDRLLPSLNQKLFFSAIKLLRKVSV